MNEYQAVNAASALANLKLSQAAQEAARVAAENEKKFIAAAEQQKLAVSAAETATIAEAEAVEADRRAVYGDETASEKRLQLLGNMQALSEQLDAANAALVAGPAPGILNQLGWEFSGKFEAKNQVASLGAALQTAASNYRTLVDARKLGFAEEVDANPVTSGVEKAKVAAGLDRLNLDAKVFDEQNQTQDTNIRAAQAGANAAGAEVERVDRAKASAQRDAAHTLSMERAKLDRDTARLQLKTTEEKLQWETDERKYVAERLGVSEGQANSILRMNPLAAVFYRAADRGDKIDRSALKDAGVAQSMALLASRNGPVTVERLDQFHKYMEDNEKELQGRNPLDPDAGKVKNANEQEMPMPLVNGKAPYEYFVGEVADAYTGRNGKPLSSEILTLVLNDPGSQKVINSPEGKFFMERQTSGVGISDEEFFNTTTINGAPASDANKLALYARLSKVAGTTGSPYNYVGGEAVIPTIRIPEVEIKRGLFSGSRLEPTGRFNNIPIDDVGAQMRALAERRSAAAATERQQQVEAANKVISDSIFNERVY